MSRYIRSQSPSQCGFHFLWVLMVSGVALGPTIGAEAKDAKPSSSEFAPPAPTKDPTEDPTQEAREAVRAAEVRDRENGDKGERGGRNDHHDWRAGWHSGPRHELPWLGVRISKPEPGTTAHLPDLPSGIGFLVDSVEPGSPALESGLKALDIIWKLDDQLLVNKGQLATLLGIHQVGGEVSLKVIRGGRPLEVQVKLGSRPNTPPPDMAAMLDAAVNPGDSPPRRVINLANRTASYANERGSLTVRSVADGFHVVILNSKGATLFEGGCSNEKEMAKIPEIWRRSVYALRRGLEHSIRRESENSEESRATRMRVIPPESQGNAVPEKTSQ